MKPKASESEVFDFLTFVSVNDIDKNNRVFTIKILIVNTLLFLSMSQPFYARKIDLNIGPRKGETVYSAQAYYYGTITTKQVATQIAQESALTPADVIGVIERLAYFCQTHMALGYKIKLDGLGIFYNELLTEKSVSTPKEVTAKLVKSIRPAFNAEYTILNGTFRYALLPEKTNLVRIDFKGGVPIVTPEEGDSESPDEI